MRIHGQILKQVNGKVVIADPKHACTPPKNGAAFWGRIVIVERGECMFIGKN